ncbi:MAG: hypothetical protein H6576_08575 [Lewinellaceae bacterium]|nr:hypothetical protein [Saprospiraceae bacterium]MCB9343737.1 hypothetical protein [Lewinellaceae bacterium]
MKLRLALSLIALAIITRLSLNLLPHPPHNFSPIAAMGLFGAVAFNRKWLAILVPFAALFISDLFLNNVIYSEYFSSFTLITSWWLYAAFGLVMMIGWFLLKEKTNPSRIIAASLLSSGVFFLISNFSTWLNGTMYPHNGAGLMTCYVAGLPFLSNTVLGDLFFTSVLFGAYFWAARLIPSKQEA